MGYKEKVRASWRKRILTTVCFLALLFAVPLYAQEDDENGAEQAASTNVNGIEMSARVGFDGLHKGSGWRPVQVTVSNEGTAVTGRLVVDSGSFGGPVYAVPIDLPTQSNKRVSFSVYDNSLQTGLIIRLEDELGNEVAKTAVENLRSLDKDDSILYGVVSPRPDALEILEKIRRGRSEAAVAFLTIDDLPQDAVAWRDLDVLVFNDVDSNQLSADQREALTFWVSQGGQLVVTGGASWQKTTAAFTEMLPVTVAGSDSVADLPALSEEAGEPFRDAGPYVIANSTLRDGELLYHQEGVPILARRSYGRGGVYFLALDPQFAPLDDWDGSEEVWLDVSRYVLRQPFWERTFAAEDQASSAVESLPDLTLPSTFLLFGFMFLYIATIGPINYIVLGYFQRRELGWVTISASIVLFSLIAYVIGLQFKGNVPIVNQVNVVAGRAGENTAYMQSAVGVYSPNRDSYDVTFEDDVLVRPLDAYSSALSSNDLEFVRDGRVRLNNTIIDVGGVGTLHANSVRPLPNITGEVSFSETGGQLRAEITVTNNGNVTLENATILFGDNSIMRIGDLDPGETDTRIETVPVAQENTFLATSNGFPPIYTMLNTDTTYSSPLNIYYDDILGTPDYYSDPIAYPRYQLLEGLYGSYVSESVWQPVTTVSLFGWTTEAQLEISLENVRHDSSATTLYILELPYVR